MVDVVGLFMFIFMFYPIFKWWWNNEKVEANARAQNRI